MTHGKGKRLGLLVLCLSGTLLFTSLGIWQIQRLAWKRDLINRVEARIHEPAVEAPPRDAWATLDTHEAEYRRVLARGVYMHDRETLVDALTTLGAGAWVLTPLRTSDGVVLVNRGFVAPDRRDAGDKVVGQVPGEVTITGLLRRSEPGGRILRPNEPAEDRWFSRDVEAIARVRGLESVAPFFIDADAGAGSDAAPRGGMTVVHFRNAHLAYALTWFGLAVLCMAGLVLVVRVSRHPAAGANRAAV